MNYICQQCGKQFISRKRPDRIVKFCSRNCSSLSLKGRKPWNKGLPAPWAKNNHFAVGHTPWNKGLKGMQVIWNKGLNKFIAPSLARPNNHPDTVGKKNPRWRGGVWNTTQGYIHILLPEHPKSNCRGYIPQQVLVAEKCLKRNLTKSEIVHHINCDKKDNRPENLFVFANNREHRRHHTLLKLEKEQPKISNLL